MPFLLFNLLSGFVSYWHLIPLLPAFCIGSAILIKDTSKLFRNNKIRKVLPYAIVSGIGTYGLIVMIMLLTLNLTSFHNQVISYISAQVQDTNATSTTHKIERVNTKHGIAVYGSNYWLWIPKYVFDRSGINEFRNYYNAKDNITNNVLLVVGENFVRDMTRENDAAYNRERLRQFLNSSDLLTVIEENQSATLQRDKYPFNSLIDLDPRASSRVEIRTNY